MKKVIITGATSFIATHLIDLLQEDYKIYAIIRRNSSKRDLLSKYKNLKVIELDMNEYDHIPEHISEECDIFYNFAWNGTRGSMRDDRELQEQNVSNSKKALVAAIDLGCSRFITAGSQAEYGMQDGKVNEEAESHPLTEYAKAKYKFSKWAKKLCEEKNIKFYEPRIFSIYGEGDYENTLIMSSIKKMLNNETLELSPCTHLWNFLYIKDAVKALKLLIEADIPSGIYNVASEDTRPLKEFVVMLKDELKSESELLFGEYSSGSSSDLNPDITKIKAFGWQEDYSFKEGIRDMLKIWE